MPFDDARSRAREIIAGINGGRKAAPVGSVSDLMCYPPIHGVFPWKSAPEVGISSNRHHLDALGRTEFAEVGVNERQPVVGDETKIRMFREYLMRSTRTRCERRCFRAALFPTAVVR